MCREGLLVHVDPGERGGHAERVQGPDGVAELEDGEPDDDDALEGVHDGMRDGRDEAEHREAREVLENVRGGVAEHHEPRDQVGGRPQRGGGGGGGKRSAIAQRGGGGGGPGRRRRGGEEGGEEGRVDVPPEGQHEREGEEVGEEEELVLVQRRRLGRSGQREPALGQARAAAAALGLVHEALLVGCERGEKREGSQHDQKQTTKIDDEIWTK